MDFMSVKYEKINKQTLLVSALRTSYRYIQYNTAMMIACPFVVHDDYLKSQRLLMARKVDFLV